MNHWFSTKYGFAPYEKVQKVVFSFDGIEKEDIAYVQYKLLLNSAVVQAHMEFSTKEAIAIFEPNTNPEQVLRKEGINYRIIDKELISYEKVLESNNMFASSK